MGTLQELLRQREQVSKEWNAARQAEVEQERAQLEPAQLKADAEMRAAELDAQIRQAQLQQSLNENAAYIEANHAAAAEFDRAIDVILGALRSGEAFAKRIGETFERQQAHANNAASEYMRNVRAVSDDPEQAYQVGLAFKNQWTGTAAKFRNALPLWAVLQRRIRDAKTPQERQFLNGIAYAYRGETYTVTQEFDPQAAVDNAIRASRRGR